MKKKKNEDGSRFKDLQFLRGALVEPGNFICWLAALMLMAWTGMQFSAVCSEGRCS